MKLKRSATPTKVPTTSDLDLGEIGINTYDGKLYIKKDDGTAAIKEVGGLPISAELSSVDGVVSVPLDGGVYYHTLDDDITLDITAVPDLPLCGDAIFYVAQPATGGPFNVAFDSSWHYLDLSISSQSSGTTEIVLRSTPVGIILNANKLHISRFLNWISIWGMDDPSAPQYNQGDVTEMGTYFTCSISGYIVGMKFYKAYMETGSHSGKLWDDSGDLLAQADFADESSSGWQEVFFDTPVPITEDTRYRTSINIHYAFVYSYISPPPCAHDPFYVVSSLYGTVGQPPMGSAYYNPFIDVLFMQDIY